MKRIIVSAGGSGGHIIPATSIIKELKKFGWDILYIGNKNSMEEEIISSMGIDFASIDVQKLYRKVTLAHLKFPWKLIRSIKKCKKIIKDFQPDAFLGTGGFVSGPAGFASSLLGLPIFLQEQNSYPGLTTRLLSKKANTIFLGNEGAGRYLPEERCCLTGNPINTGALEETETMDFSRCGMRWDTIKIFLTGGSQGSVILNNALYAIADRLLERDIEIFWQVGRYSFQRFDQLLKDKSGIFYFDFTSEMGKIYNSIDMVIARAGALSLGEFETKAIPSLLIPLPSAAENHQYYNAKEMEEKGIARVLEQKNLGSDQLFDLIIEMLNNIDAYKKSFTKSPHREAAGAIAKMINEKFEQVKE